MTKRPHRSTDHGLAQRFVKAERRGDLGAAERLLAALFGLLPAVEPMPGFADRVVERLSREAVTARSAKRRIPLEVLAAALFLGTGLALRMAPYWLTPVVARIELPTWPSRLWSAIVGVGDATLEVANAAAGSLRFSQLILTSPQGVALVAVCVAIAVLSARLLHSLLERSTDHV